VRAPSRDEVEASRGESLAQGSALKPAVFLVRGREGTCVVKDARSTALLWRPFARALLRREERVLVRLDGLEGVPRLLGRVDADAIAMTLVEGRPLSHETAREASGDFFERLERLVDAIHARGVVHLDLRQKRNVLVGKDGLPRVIDFGAALSPPPPLALALRAIDRTAALKFRLKYRPATVPAQARARHRRFERVRRLWFVSRMRRRRPGERA
jgi:RIO-like serine/threonine protein kinase